MNEKVGHLELSLNVDYDQPENLVSVIIPTYEDSELLKPALRSVSQQTYNNIEIVIVDSSGVEWLQELSVEEEGVKYIYQDPEGLASARNIGIKQADGGMIGFLDADDEWYPRKLEKQVQELKNGVNIVYSDIHILTDSGNKRYLSSLSVENQSNHHIDFLYNGGVPIVSVLVSSECLESNPFNEDLPAVEDRNLLARLFASYSAGRVAEPLAIYRQRQESMSSDAAVMYDAEISSLEHLASKLPSVADHYEELVALAEYKYGKRLLRSNNPGEARNHLVTAVNSGYIDRRVILLLLISLLPLGHRQILWYLERLQEYLS